MREREGERERGRERAREQEREGECATTKDEDRKQGMMARVGLACFCVFSFGGLRSHLCMLLRQQLRWKDVMCGRRGKPEI